MDTANKVLIIDDESSLLLGLSVLMKRSGYQVFTAENGKQGFRLAKEKLPDIIISDVMMPPPNGFELRDLLSNNAKTAEIPFIFLTALTHQEDRLCGIKSGADDYVTKPFYHEELIARVEAVLRRSKIERERGRLEMKQLAKEQMEKFKHEILQNFHHELRTPLSNILLPLEVAVSQKYSEPEDLIAFTQIALSNASRLQSLIEDLFLLTNIDHGELNTIRQEIDLESHFRNPIKKRLERYSDKQLEIHYDIKVSDEINAPRNEFKRSVIHLVDNAFKFSPDGGRVEINLNDDGDGGCSLIVLDEGPGIPSDAYEKVFERYYQISQGDSRAFEGLGVGLTITRAIARSLGGDVEFISTSKGCKVVFTIPPGKNEF